MTAPDHRVQLRHPDPAKQAPSIGRRLYEATRSAILVAACQAGGIHFADLRAEVERRVPSGTFARASAGWYTTAVKLDLEARGEIRRVAGETPQRIEVADR